MNIVLLTGCSGAGKSRAANILEDWGYTCVDNIPLTMISVLVDMHRKDATSGDKLAIVTDVRCTTDFRALSPLVQSLREAGDICRVVYLDCRDDVLINRYKFTRRLHPLTLRYGTGMEDALLRERQMLRDAYECADVRIDTSDITPAQLTQILEHALAGETHNGIYICCMSFGFKYGIPPEADTVFDVRCFPNPYHVEGLREKNGLHPEV
ncbi:MAG: RNase adaptor protein RapZ, partial [Clostridia bacterium]|nr:RNase adaptor protein RapZ [Clostridia bacterium]